MTLPLTVLPATALAGSVTVVVTSAKGEIAVVLVVVSVSVFGPWLVDVPISLAMITDPLAGAVKATPTLMLDPAPRLVGMPVNVTAPLAGSYVALAPAGKPVNVTPESPGGRPRMNIVPAAIDGPAFVYVTVPLTGVPATADGGIEIVVVTSASGEMAVVSLALSGAVFGPWLVEVPMLVIAITDPEAGAVKLTPIVIVAPDARLVGMLVNVTAPLAAL